MASTESGHCCGVVLEVGTCVFVNNRERLLPARAVVLSFRRTTKQPLDPPHSNSMDALITAATSADERRRGAKIAVLPVGSFEQHGDHLPLTTDTVIHGAPHLVRDGVESSDHDAPERPHLLTLGMADYTQNGIIGRPSLGTAEKGRALLDSLSKSVAEHLSLIGGN